MRDFTQILEDSLNVYWRNFVEALPQLATGVIIVVVGIFIASWISRIFEKKIITRSKDPLTALFLSKAINFIFLIAVIMLALYASGLGGIAGALLTAAGASAVILGFAFKDIGENFIAGVILAFNRPFNVNDTIMVGEVFGRVKKLELRYTKIKTFDGRDVYIPNSDVITTPVTNYTEDGFYRLEFIVGIAYEDDIEGAKETILQALNTTADVINDEEHESFVVEDELAVSTLNLKVLFWTDTSDYRKAAVLTRGKVIKAVKEALLLNNYNLPSDIKEIKLYGTSQGIPIVLKNEKTPNKKE